MVKISHSMSINREDSSITDVIEKEKYHIFGVLRFQPEESDAIIRGLAGVIEKYENEHSRKIFVNYESTEIFDKRILHAYIKGSDGTLQGVISHKGAVSRRKEKRNAQIILKLSNPNIQDMGQQMLILYGRIREYTPQIVI